MNKQIKIKKVVTAIVISFIIIMIAGNIPREAHAFTLKSEEVISAISKNKKESSQSMGQPGRFLPTVNDQVHVVPSQKRDNGLFHTVEEGKSISSFNKDAIYGKKRSEFKLIQGDFCLTGLDHSDRFWHFTEDRDDPRQTPSPSPVPLPATALFLGTGLAVLAGLVSRKEFVA